MQPTRRRTDTNINSSVHRAASTPVWWTTSPASITEVFQGLQFVRRKAKPIRRSLAPHPAAAPSSPNATGTLVVRALSRLWSLHGDRCGHPPRRLFRMVQVSHPSSSTRCITRRRHHPRRMRSTTPARSIRATSSTGVSKVDVGSWVRPPLGKWESRWGSRKMVHSAGGSRRPHPRRRVHGTVARSCCWLGPVDRGRRRWRSTRTW